MYWSNAIILYAIFIEMHVRSTDGPEWWQSFVKIWHLITYIIPLVITATMGKYIWNALNTCRSLTRRCLYFEIALITIFTIFYLLYTYTPFDTITINILTRIGNL